MSPHQNWNQTTAPPPAYLATAAIDAVLCAAQHPVRQFVADGVARAMITTQAPARLLDAGLRRFDHQLHDTAS